MATIKQIEKVVEGHKFQKILNLFATLCSDYRAYGIEQTGGKAFPVVYISRDPQFLPKEALRSLPNTVCIDFRNAVPLLLREEEIRYINSTDENPTRASSGVFQERALGDHWYQLARPRPAYTVLSLKR